MRIECRLALIVLATWLIPAVASAQGSITGVVRDTSGAVLPGVTVEASSPALIEKVALGRDRQHRAVPHRGSAPGLVRRSRSRWRDSAPSDAKGIELTGSFAAHVNAELRVGALEETITVSGETPIVDVVNAKQQSVLDNDVIAAIPTARLYHSLVTLVPGVSLSGSQDVGGLAGPLTVTFDMRGGPGNEGRLTVDGLSLGASLNGTGVSYTVADVGNAQEVVFSTAGSLGEAENAGPAMNLVPRQGGNRFSGTVFANWANGSMQSDNFSEEIQRARPPRAERPVAHLGHEPRGRRTDQPGSSVVLRGDALPGQPSARRRHVPQPQRGRSQRVDLRAGRESPGEGRQQLEERERAAHLAGQPTQQVQFLLGRAAQLHAVRRRRHGDPSSEARGNNQSPPRVQQATWTSPATNRLLSRRGSART